MSRTEKTFFRQALLTRMLLEADPPSRAERRPHTHTHTHTRDPESRGRRCGEAGSPQAPYLPYQGGTLTEHPTSPPQPPPTNPNTWYLLAFTTQLLCQKGDPELKEAPLQADRKLHSNKGAGPNLPLPSRPTPQLQRALNPGAWPEHLSSLLVLV